MKKYKTSIILFLVFEAIAVSLWLGTGSLFFLLNFSYIGICIAVGGVLMVKGWKYAREFVQFAVGSYMLVFLGLIGRENMQIEGFWFYLASGIFGGATLHYLIAKIFGPLLFGRGWCGYCCWTAMILDLLPYKQPQGKRAKIGFFRYITFSLSLILVGVLIYLGKTTHDMFFRLFIIGNIVYYVVGIALAIIFRDDRAFCKYFCPITVFLKPMSYFSRLRIHCDENKCIQCGKCLKVCPMDVEVNKDSRKRENATECILCQKCKKACPVNALK